MSRRTGQNGTIEVRNGAYRGRWLEDVPGQVERVKRSVVLGFVKEMTRSEAKRKLREIITASGINSPRYRIPSADCFAKRVEWWEQNYLVRQKPATRKQFSYHVRKYLLPKWGKAPVDGITADQVNEWIGAPELAHLSRVSIKLVVDTLCLVLGRRFKRKEIHYPAQVHAAKEPPCYTPEQMAAIIAAATGKWRVMFATAAETGARVGELLGLEVPDIDFTRCIIHVRRSMFEGKQQSPKTQNSYRAIDVQPSLIAMLKEHLDGRTTGLVFQSDHGTPLWSGNLLNRVLHPILRRLGIPQGGMHGFRHGRVSFLVEHGAPVEVIKAWIGHGSDAMIRRYTHLRPQYRSRVLASMPAVFAPLPPDFHRGKVVQIA